MATSNQAILSFEGLSGPALWYPFALTGSGSGVAQATIMQGTGRRILAVRIFPVSTPADANFVQIGVQNAAGQALPSNAFPAAIPVQVGSANPTPVGLPIDPGTNNTLNFSGLTSAHTYTCYVLFARAGSMADQIG